MCLVVCVWYMFACRGVVIWVVVCVWYVFACRGVVICVVVWRYCAHSAACICHILCKHVCNKSRRWAGIFVLLYYIDL